jgi:hypothetical protein
VAVRSEYRRKYDNQAAITQDILDEIDHEWERQLSAQSRPQPSPQPRQPEPRVVSHNAHGNGQQREAMSPPWESELDDHRATRYAASVSAPPSRDYSSISYAPPKQDDGPKAKAAH